MKPIEPGCLALVIDCPAAPHIVGRQTQVHRFVSPHELVRGARVVRAGWLCDDPEPDEVTGLCVFAVRQLLRIDDDYSLAQRRTQEVTA